MTRYVLKHRTTGEVWPIQGDAPGDFDNMTLAELWAILYNVPTEYVPVPINVEEDQ